MVRGLCSEDTAHLQWSGFVEEGRGMQGIAFVAVFLYSVNSSRKEGGGMQQDPRKFQRNLWEGCKPNSRAEWVQITGCLVMDARP